MNINMGRKMVRTVKMTLGTELAAALDKAARKLGVGRSAFAQHALWMVLRRQPEASLELKHREGYRRHPVRRGEFSA